MASGFGLIVLSPLFLVLAIWIKADSRGPVFYRQTRVGRGNRDFRLFKFRSMRIGSDRQGLITVGGHDPRVTRSGYYILLLGPARRVPVRLRLSGALPAADGRVLRCF